MIRDTLVGHVYAFMWNPLQSGWLLFLFMGDVCGNSRSLWWVIDHIAHKMMMQSFENTRTWYFQHVQCALSILYIAKVSQGLAYVFNINISLHKYLQFFKKIWRIFWLQHYYTNYVSICPFAGSCIVFSIPLQSAVFLCRCNSNSNKLFTMIYSPQWRVPVNERRHCMNKFSTAFFASSQKNNSNWTPFYFL